METLLLTLVLLCLTLFAHLLACTAQKAELAFSVLPSMCASFQTICSQPLA